jgi:hypothetical protein
MTRVKTLIVMGLGSVLLLIINACCDEGFRYKWQDIIIQQYSNGEPVLETTINQSEFSMRVHLLSSKSANSTIRVPKLFDYAYANDCSGKYLIIDELDDIDVLLVTTENGLPVKSVVTYLFEAALNYDLGSKIEVFDLPMVINQQSSKPIEYFDLTLKENLDKEINGQFMILVTLADDRELSDTTETLTLKLQ